MLAYNFATELRLQALCNVSVTHDVSAFLRAQVTPIKNEPMSIYNVYALMFSNVVSVLAGRVLVTLYALNLGAKPFTVGLLAASFALFPMLLSWVSGRLSDRFGPRWPMMFGACGNGLGLLIAFVVPGVPALFLVAISSGLSLCFFNVSTQNLVGVLSNETNRARNYANYTLFGSIGNFLGPMIAGFSIDHFGYRPAFALLAAFSIVPVFQLAIWGDRLPAGSGKAAGKSGALREILGNRKLLAILITSSLAQSGNNIFQFYMPVYGHSLQLSASAIGIVLAMCAGAGFFSRSMLPKLISKFGEHGVLIYAFLLGAFSFALVPLCSSVLLLGVLSMLFGFGINCSQPITMMLMFGGSKQGRSGEAMGLRLTLDNITKLSSPVVFGAIASTFGLAAVFWISACLLTCGSALNRVGKKLS